MKDIKSFFSLEWFDWPFFIAIFLLLIIGLVIQFSLNLNNETGTSSTFHRQLIFAVIGIIFFLFCALIDYRSIKRLSTPLYLFSLFLLFLVLILGRLTRGTRGWLFGIQIVEFAKIATVIALAKYWSVYRESGQIYKKIIGSAVIVFVPMVLTLLQPDFGSALIFLPLWIFTALLFNPIKWSTFFKLLFITIVLAIICWFTILKDFQKDRLLNFIDPYRDAKGSGYQVSQSIIAIGSGQILGRGFGLGSQSHLRFLPETKTDFVFSAIAEELGFAFAGVALILYLILFYRIFKILKIAYDDFGIFLIFGFAIIFFIQFWVNIGMNLGLAPITGIPLPLLSYGGSSLLMSLIALGLIQSVSLHQVRALGNEISLG